MIFMIRKSKPSKQITFHMIPHAKTGLLPAKAPPIKTILATTKRIIIAIINIDKPPF